MTSGLGRCLALVGRGGGGGSVAGQAQPNGQGADHQTERGHHSKVDPPGMKLVSPYFLRYLRYHHLDK